MFFIYIRYRHRYFVAIPVYCFHYELQVVPSEGKLIRGYSEKCYRTAKNLYYEPTQQYFSKKNV